MNNIASVTYEMSKKVQTRRLKNCSPFGAKRGDLWANEAYYVTKSRPSYNPPADDDADRQIKELADVHEKVVLKRENRWKCV